MPTTLLFDGRGPRPPEVQPGQVFNLKVPAFPEFIFEWHPESKKVYVARLGVHPVIGEVIAMNVTDHGMAYNFVFTWTRGYRTARMESEAPGEHVPGLVGA